MGTQPKRYRAKFIEPGLISYEDIGEGVVLVTRQALDRMLPTFVGQPIFNFDHKMIDAEDAFDFSKQEIDELACGIVSGVGTDETGWDYADLMVWDEESQKNLDERGFSVSCAYRQTESKPGGDKNGIPYDEEIVDGHYIHMAIVKKPRYEKATVFPNSKGGKAVDKNAKKKGWSLFIRKNAEDPKPEDKPAVPAEKPEDKKPTDEKMNADDAYVEIGGEKVPLTELIEEYVEDKDDTSLNGEALSPDTKVTLPNGQECTVGDLIQHRMGKQNSEVIDQEKPNPEKGKPELKENSKPGKEQPNEAFLEIKKNAKGGEAIDLPSINTREDRLATGKARYGRSVPVGGDK